MTHTTRQLTSLIAILALTFLPQPLLAQHEGDDILRQIFTYCPGERAGLHAAYLDLDNQWHEIGQLCSCDYGQWGAEKRMYHPNLVHAADGTWRAVWQVSDNAPCFAAAYSPDLITWRPQDYPKMSTRSCERPIVFEGDDGMFDIYYKSGDERRYVYASNDFRTFSPDVESSIGDAAWGTSSVTIGDRDYEGQIFDISQGELIQLLTHFELLRRDGEMSSERMGDDATRFKDLQAASATLTVHPGEKKAISDKLIGIFFEDISYAADGGLYAELVQNRDFEYSSQDRREWSATTAWTSPSPITVETDNPLSANNPHYVVLEATPITNEGWDGIMDPAPGQAYEFSMHVRNIDCKKKQWLVQLVASTGEVLAESKLTTRGTEWQQYTAVLNTNQPKTRPIGDDILTCSLRLTPLKKGKAAVDMVSLFPQETFHNHKNGLRKDLAQVIADLQPKFVRFPGGCMSHGQGIGNIYHWNHTVGALQDRKPDFNIWGYHQTRGLGFYEYFLFCEDIGAEPLPVLAAGVPCQNSAANSKGYGGQQGGIPMEEMDAYCQEILDMIEWANGNPATSRWARLRAEAGHPEPFHLKYVGIGNEDLISSVFEERYGMICKAIKEKYPNIIVCGTVGPFHTPSADYVEGWDYARKHHDIIDMVDEHYYESTGWFINHQDYYDNYDRKEAKVYLGEYAASTREKRSNVETALAEAIHLCNVERNGDVVAMTSYAPLLAKDKHHNWNPDLIYFSNTTVRTTPSYETQRLFSIHSGDRYVDCAVNADHNIINRVVASVVEDSKTGKRHLKVVNALPVALTLHVEGLSIPTGTSYEGFSGKPADQQVTLEKGTVTSGTLTLPPYSLRVFEF
ncbi:MAG: alpha-N-arabinofuranosidase [Prevotella sp.]|nr:alpha-N-arabinofuranosidase [Prevotella sp.]